MSMRVCASVGATVCVSVGFSVCASAGTTDCVSVRGFRENTSFTSARLLLN